MLIYLGSKRTLVVSSSEVARKIMKTHDSSSSSRPNLLVSSSIVTYGSKDMAFSPYGEYWRQLKSIVVVNLLSNTRVKSFQRVREKEIDCIIGVIENSCGSLFDMRALLISFTNNIISRATVERTYDGLELTNMLRRYVTVFTVSSVGSCIPWLSWVDQLSGFNGKARAIAAEDMIVAGTDTSPTTLEWAINELIKQPRVMKKLQEEAIDIAQGRHKIFEEGLGKMKYLKAVIKETLRLHPPVPLLIPRESTQDVKLMGYDILIGTQVFINVWAIGRDPAVWNHSEEFWPERFLNNAIDYKGVHFEWLPFGSGRRGCPGIQFGVMVVELALANIIYKFDMKLPNGVKFEDLDMNEEFGFTLCGKTSLMVIASPPF
ncbi:putative cytochrome P450 [Tanacetum coccineum]